MYIVKLKKVSDFHLKVILNNNYYFFVPFGYSKYQINSILREYFNKKRKIRFYKEV